MSPRQEANAEAAREEVQKRFLAELSDYDWRDLPNLEHADAEKIGRVFLENWEAHKEIEGVTA